ncbi:MAG: hypothetical protein HN348_31610 [Proteobacteria bacterium]|jgi:hypothetical protein|nr:hypothetical protein [Pseudomonadota bacterium]
MATQFDSLLEQDSRPEVERHGLAQLMALFYELPPPPDSFGLYNNYAPLKQRFIDATSSGNLDLVEEAFLALYCHIHGYEVPYTDAERSRVTATAGYLCHPGGVSPILKAAPHIHGHTVSGDFGSGNGLQGLLLQYLFPHKKAVQIEISSRLTEVGRQLQSWMGIDDDRVEWLDRDIMEVSPTKMDFVYLYRPVRPIAEGKLFYEQFAAALETAPREVVVFSVADCLGSFLSPAFERFFHDGHLSCFRRSSPEDNPGKR